MSSTADTASASSAPSAPSSSSSSSWSLLIDNLARSGIITNDQDQLFEHAREIASCDDPAVVVNDCIELVLSTRARPADDVDPQMDAKLLVAASNALSILNYGSICGLLAFHFTRVRDWRYIRVPHVNLNHAVLYGCRFDHADLSYASLYQVDATRCSFRHANLTGVRHHCSQKVIGGLKYGDNALESAAFSRNGRIVVGQRKTPPSIIYYDFMTGVWESFGISPSYVMEDVSPDASIIAAYENSVIVLLSTRIRADLLPETRLEGHADKILRIRFSPNGRYLASSATKDVVRVWDLSQEGYPCIHTLQCDQGAVQALAFSQDSTLLAVGSDQSKIAVFNVDSGECLKEIELPGPAPQALAFSQDQTKLFVATSLHAILVDVERGEIEVECTQAPNQVPLSKWSRRDETKVEVDLRRVDGITLCEMYGIPLADVIRNATVQFPDDTEPGNRRRRPVLCLSYDKRYVLLNTDWKNEHLEILDVGIASWLEKLFIHLDYVSKSKGKPIYMVMPLIMSPRCVVVSPDGSWVAIRRDQTATLIHVFDTHTGLHRQSINMSSKEELQEISGFSNLTASDENTLIACTSTRIYLWDIRTGKLTRLLRHSNYSPYGSDCLVYGLALPNRTDIALLSLDTRAGGLRFVDLEEKEQKASDDSDDETDESADEGHAEKSSITKSRYPTYASRSSVLPRPAQVRDAVGTYSRDTEHYVHIVCSRDGTRLATSRYDQKDVRGPIMIDIWDFTTGRRVSDVIFNISFKEHHWYPTALSSNGTKLILIGPRGLTPVWDLVSPAAPKFKLRDTIKAAAFSFNDEFIITLSAESNDITFWNANTGQVIYIHRLLEPLDYMALLGDGSTLFTLSAKETRGGIWVWSIDFDKLRSEKPDSSCILLERRVGFSRGFCFQECDFSGAILSRQDAMWKSHGVQ